MPSSFAEAELEDSISINFEESVASLDGTGNPFMYHAPVKNSSPEEGYGGGKQQIRGTQDIDQSIFPSTGFTPLPPQEKEVDQYSQFHSKGIEDSVPQFQQSANGFIRPELDNEQKNSSEERTNLSVKKEVELLLPLKEVKQQDTLFDDDFNDSLNLQSVRSMPEEKKNSKKLNEAVGADPEPVAIAPKRPQPVLKPKVIRSPEVASEPVQLSSGYGVDIDLTGSMKPSEMPLSDQEKPSLQLIPEDITLVVAAEDIVKNTHREANPVTPVTTMTPISPISPVTPPQSQVAIATVADQRTLDSTLPSSVHVEPIVVKAKDTNTHVSNTLETPNYNTILLQPVSDHAVDINLANSMKPSERPLDSISAALSVLPNDPAAAEEEDTFEKIVVSSLDKTLPREELLTARSKSTRLEATVKLSDTMVEIEEDDEIDLVLDDDDDDRNDDLKDAVVKPVSDSKKSEIEPTAEPEPIKEESVQQTTELAKKPTLSVKKSVEPRVKTVELANKPVESTKKTMELTTKKTEPAKPVAKSTRAIPAHSNVPSDVDLAHANLPSANPVDSQPLLEVLPLCLEPVQEIPLKKNMASTDRIVTDRTPKKPLRPTTMELTPVKPTVASLQSTYSVKAKPVVSKTSEKPAATTTTTTTPTKAVPIGVRSSRPATAKPVFAESNATTTETTSKPIRPVLSSRPSRPPASNTQSLSHSSPISQTSRSVSTVNRTSDQQIQALLTQARHVLTNLGAHIISKRAVDETPNLNPDTHECLALITQESSSLEQLSEIFITGGSALRQVSRIFTTLTTDFSDAQLRNHHAELCLTVELCLWLAGLDLDLTTGRSSVDEAYIVLHGFKGEPGLSRIASSNNNTYSNTANYSSNGTNNNQSTGKWIPPGINVGTHNTTVSKKQHIPSSHSIHNNSSSSTRGVYIPSKHGPLPSTSSESSEESLQVPSEKQQLLKKNNSHKNLTADNNQDVPAWQTQLLQAHQVIAMQQQQILQQQQLLHAQLHTQQQQPNNDIQQLQMSLLTALISGNNGSLNRQMGYNSNNNSSAQYITPEQLSAMNIQPQQQQLSNTSAQTRGVQMQTAKPTESRVKEDISDDSDGGGVDGAVTPVSRTPEKKLNLDTISPSKDFVQAANVRRPAVDERREQRRLQLQSGSATRGVSLQTRMDLAGLTKDPTAHMFLSQFEPNLEILYSCFAECLISPTGPGSFRSVPASIVILAVTNSNIFIFHKANKEVPPQYILHTQLPLSSIVALLVPTDSKHMLGLRAEHHSQIFSQIFLSETTLDAMRDPRNRPVSATVSIISPSRVQIISQLQAIRQHAQLSFVDYEYVTKDILCRK